MTSRQKIQLRMSEVRDRLNEIGNLEGDAYSDEIKSEERTLQNEYKELGTRERSAIIAEGEEEQRALGQFRDTQDGESAEIRGLMQRVSIGDYLSPAAAGTGLSGVSAELAAALKVETAGKSGGVAIPWEVLIGTEQRALDFQPRSEHRAFTTTAANDGPELQRPILQRLFGPGILDTLGVRIDSVPVGRTEWPLITGGVAPAQAEEGDAAAAAVSATFSFANLKPKRLTGMYEYTHEMAASVAALEQALRRDLADAVRSKMSDLIINGAAPTNADPQNVQGFLATIDAPSDASAVATYADYASSHASGIDGIHAEMETEVSSVIGTDVYQHAATVYQTGSGESGSEALRRRSRSCRASSYIPAASSGQSKGNLYHLSGPNGGAMRGDSVAAMWPTLEVIRDIYSKASQGVVLTWVALWDAKVAFRSAAYQRVAFKIGA